MLKDMLFTSALMGSSGGGGGGSALFVVGMDSNGVLDKTYKEIVSASNDKIVIIVYYDKEEEDEFWEIRYFQTYNHFTEDGKTTYNVSFFNHDGASYYSADSEDGYPKFTPNQ